MRLASHSEFETLALKHKNKNSGTPCVFFTNKHRSIFNKTWINSHVREPIEISYVHQFGTTGLKQTVRIANPVVSFRAFEV